MPDYRKLNRDKMVAFFERGDKYSRKLGFELEHVLLHKGTHAPVSYSEPGGVRDILKRLAPAYDKQARDEDDIIGLMRSGEAITIEPAGQLEISAATSRAPTSISDIGSIRSSTNSASRPRCSAITPPRARRTSSSSLSSAMNA